MKKRILIAEDDTIIAFDIVATLKRSGYEPVGPAVSLRRARELLASGVDGAIIDYDLNGETADSLIEDLERRGLPFVLASGATAHVIGVGQNNRSFDKPMMSTDLISALRMLLDGGCDDPQDTARLG